MPKQRHADFPSLAAALDYAASGGNGLHFYDARGNLSRVLTYHQLRDEARLLAGRLLGFGCKRGDRVAIVAETDPLFPIVFCACQYAGLVPVALPASVQAGAHDAYIEQLERMLRNCRPKVAVAPGPYYEFLREAASHLADVTVFGTEELNDLPAVPEQQLDPLGEDDLAYLQYTSGSTRFPRGVAISQRSALSNVREIAEHGLKLTPVDRFNSWLPFYHDMGLVGFLLLPLATQLSVDLLSPRTFAMRPRVWLKILSETRATVASSPPFGYALCAKRLRPEDAKNYDLSNWRAACVGAERIHGNPLREFAKALAPSGFDAKSFIACYGMAECTLAVSFAPLGEGVAIDRVCRQRMVEDTVAEPVSNELVDDKDVLEFVDCGIVMPSFEFAIRDENGRELPDRHCGRVWLRGDSIMDGYFEDPAATHEVMTSSGWLDTGDVGYCVGRRLFITSRSKDVIIVNGRNIWPHDLEQLTDDIDGVRHGNVSAFAAPAETGEDIAVLVVESREQDPSARFALMKHIEAMVRTHFGINSCVDVVSPGTLPRTSSGKLARGRARLEFLARAESSDASNGATVKKVGIAGVT